MRARRIGQFEGLRKIIVGAGFESSQDVFRAVPSRQHQRRNELARCPELRHDREAVNARQHDIEDHYIEPGRAGTEQFERSLASLNDIYVVLIELRD